MTLIGKDLNASVLWKYIPPASLLSSGTKWFSRSLGECCAAIFLSESTALSLTTVSSTVARLSSGG